MFTVTDFSITNVCTLKLKGITKGFQLFDTITSDTLSYALTLVCGSGFSVYCWTCTPVFNRMDICIIRSHNDKLKPVLSWPLCHFY